MGHTNPNARGAIFLAVAALFEQGWDFGLRLSPRWHAAALCLFTGTANSLARYRYGTTIALDQFVLTGYGLVAFIVARQRRRENDRTNQNHQEQLDFLTGYSFALGQQKSDLAFHDLKTIAHLMTTSGSRDAREILEGQDELGVMTHVPQLGIVPLGEVVGPEVEPEGAWAFPITPHRKERILSQLSKHSAVTRFQVINYAHLLTDPRMQMQIAVNERVHDVGPPVDKQSFRLEPDVFVFLFAAFWFATEVFVPLPPWLRYVQLAGIMLCLNCAFETQRKGIDNAPKARTAFMTLAVLERN